MRQYISKHQHHKKSALNFHISKSTGHKNTRNQAPPFAIDLNENFIVYITHLVFTPNPPSRPTIDNSTKNSVSTVHTHIHYSCEMAIFSYFCTLNHCKYSQGPFLIFFSISLMYNRTRASFSITAKFVSVRKTTCR